MSRRGSGGSSRGRGVYDRFRGRIIFPIRDASGAASGLGGRVIGSATDTAKYINTPATLLFDKSRTLYLIDRAKSAIRKQGRAVLVEGNTDALMAHQEGFDNVVGSLGTALTPGHVELVTRYAPRIALAYDVDAAGQSAATFGATELTALVGEIERSPYRGRLTDVDMVRLPDGRDPDEVIRDDPEIWRRATDAPQPIMEFLIDRFAQRYDPKSISGREQLINAVVPTLRTITDPVRRDGYVQLLARRSGVDERVVREALTQREPPAALRGGRTGPGSRINLEAIMATPGALDPQAVERALTRPESSLLRLLLLHPEQIERVRERLTPDLLELDAGARALEGAARGDRPDGREGVRPDRVPRRPRADHRRRRPDALRPNGSRSGRRACTDPGRRAEPPDAAPPAARRDARFQASRAVRSRSRRRCRGGRASHPRRARPAKAAPRARPGARLDVAALQSTGFGQDVVLVAGSRTPPLTARPCRPRTCSPRC